MHCLTVWYHIHQNHDHQNLTSHMMVLGRLKLIPSMLGAGEERHRGVTRGKFIFLYFLYLNFVLHNPYLLFLLCFSLCKNVYVFLKHLTKSDYSRAIPIWRCQSVSRGLFYLRELHISRQSASYPPLHVLFQLHPCKRNWTRSLCINSMKLALSAVFSLALEKLWWPGKVNINDPKVSE